MVERYKHGDPMPGDPWLTRVTLKHPRLASTMFVVSAVFMGIVLTTAAVGAVRTNEAHKARQLNAQFDACIRDEGFKIREEMLSNTRWPWDVANEQSKVDAASGCCKKLGRVPLYTGASVVCLKPMYVDLTYPR